MTGTSGTGDGDQRADSNRWPTPEPILEAGIDFEHANAARMYDYFLGGGHHFAVDRDIAAQVSAANPDIIEIARANRAFLDRVVRWCVAEGFDQFLDLGSGVPTVGNVHEIAHAINPDARVAYVDFEPVAVAHAESIVRSLARVTVTRADLRDPASVLRAPGVAGLLDFDRPIALLAVAVLHFVDGDVAELLTQYRAALAPGSAMAISHASDDYDDPVLVQRLRDGVAPYVNSATPMVVRDRTQLRALFGAADLVEPGLVDVRDWPDAHPDQPGAGTYGLVARLS